MITKRAVSNRPVAIVDKNGKVITLFNTMKEAAINSGVLYSSIAQCCAGVQSTAGGYKWRYV
jgi:hypothetical protein